jgi:hypothetical protein
MQKGSSSALLVRKLERLVYLQVLMTVAFHFHFSNNIFNILSIILWTYLLFYACGVKLSQQVTFAWILDSFSYYFDSSLCDHPSWWNQLRFDLRWIRRFLDQISQVIQRQNNNSGDYSLLSINLNSEDLSGNHVEMTASSSPAPSSIPASLPPNQLIVERGEAHDSSTIRHKDT